MTSNSSGFQGGLFMSNVTSKHHPHCKNAGNGISIEHSIFLDGHVICNRMSHRVPYIPIEEEQALNVEGSEDYSKSDDFEASGSEQMGGSCQMSPAAESISPDGSLKEGGDDGSSEVPPLNPVGYFPHVDFSLNDWLDTDTATAGAKPGSNGFNFRQLLTPQYLQDRELAFKELLRQERNRDAAHRSNTKKKIEKESRKREIYSLKKLETKLRGNEMELRRQNKLLRLLVYQSGYRIQYVQFDKM